MFHLKNYKMNTNNNTLKFKTNIKCGGCVAQVTPFLNGAEGISHWDVDTTNKDKILSVHSEGITENEVIQKVQEAGFKIEILESA
jgi:copper chaperone CopZ